MALTKVSSKTLSDNAVTSDKIAAGAISVSDMADNSITAAKLHTSVQGALGTRNLIINGNMQIAQRGTSATISGGNAYHTVDRFLMNIDTTIFNCRRLPFPARIIAASLANHCHVRRPTP